MNEGAAKSKKHDKLVAQRTPVRAAQLFFIPLKTIQLNKKVL